MLVFFNSIDGSIQARSLDDFKNNFGLRWIFHNNREVDIGMIPFPVDLEHDDLKTVPDNLFLSSDNYYEIYDVFFLSYQPGINVQRKISPIIRSETISLMNDDNTFFIDAAFPGNSGSPVFLKPSTMTYGKNGTSHVSGGFIEIIGEYLPYREKAVSLQTGRVRIVFEENTGLFYKGNS
jgi:hypothetical protein